MNKWLDRYESGGLVSKNSLNRNVTCSNCGWSWKLSDGGLDPMTCHKCGGDIKMREGGELDEYEIKGEYRGQVPTSDVMQNRVPIGMQQIPTDPLTGQPLTREQISRFMPSFNTQQPVISQGTWKGNRTIKDNSFDPYSRIIEQDPQSEANVGKRMRKDFITKKVPAGVTAAAAIMAAPLAAPIVSSAMSAPLTIGSTILPYVTPATVIGAGFGLTGANKFANDLQSGYYLNPKISKSEKIFTGLTTGLDMLGTPGAVEAIGSHLIAPAYKGALKAGKYLTEETALKNAYNILPEGVFKGYSKLKNPNKSYRVAGLDAFEDFKNTGVLRSNNTTPPQLVEGTNFMLPPRPTGFPSFQKGYADMAYAPEEGAVVFETGLPTFKRGEINPVTGFPIKGRHYAHRVIDPETGAVMTEIPGEHIRMFGDKPHWLKGYLQIPKQLPGSPNVVSSVDDVAINLESQIAKLKEQEVLAEKFRKKLWSDYKAGKISGEDYNIGAKKLNPDPFNNPRYSLENQLKQHNVKQDIIKTPQQNILKSENQLGKNISDGGTNNKGVFELGDDYVARLSAHGYDDASRLVNYADKIKSPRIAKTLQVKEIDGKVYQVQNKVTGTPIPKLSETELQNIPKEHIDNFWKDKAELDNLGLSIDISGGKSNIFYDPKKGFQFIDLGIGESSTNEVIAQTYKGLQGLGAKPILQQQKNGGPIVTSRGQWLDKYKDRGQVRYTVPTSDNLQYQKPIVSNFIVDPLSGGYVHDPARAAALLNQPTNAGTISKTKDRSVGKQIYNVATNPMTSAQQLINKQPVTGLGPKNPYDFAFDAFPAIMAARQLPQIPGNIQNGEYLQAGLNALSVIPFLPKIPRGLPRVLSEGQPYEGAPHIYEDMVPINGRYQPRTVITDAGVKNEILGLEATPVIPLNQIEYPVTPNKFLYGPHSSFGKMEKGVVTDTYRGMPPGTNTYTSTLPSYTSFPNNNFKSEIDWSKWNKEIPENAPLIKEYNAIEQTSKANNTWMKNPDGSPFQGTPEQFVQQNSENFKKAFGNTKFKDEKGKPMILHHGHFTDRDFSSFLPSKRSGISNSGYEGDYSFFTPHKSLAEDYAGIGMVDDIPGYKSHVKSVYINSENPLLDARTEFADIDIPKSLREGRDAITRSLDPKEFSEVAVPYGNNVKSATGNNGMFDMTNPNIYKAIVPAAIGAGALNQKQRGGPIVTNRGQWDYPGQTTIIPSNQITMQGVPYPVVGVDNTGHTKMMHPGMNYTFPGQYVTEYPMAQNGKQVKKSSNIVSRKNVSGDALTSTLKRELVASFPYLQSLGKSIEKGISYITPDYKSQEDRELLFRRHRPVEYPSISSGLADVVRDYSSRIFNTEIRKPFRDKEGDYEASEEAWRMTLGLPVKSKYIIPSAYRPLNETNKASKYYTLNEKMYNKDLLRKKVEELKLKPGQSALINSFAPFINENYMNRDEFSQVDPIQNFQIGVNKKGKMYFYDKYDFDFEPATKVVKPYEYEFYNEFKTGGEMIKRADGSYSKRGLWDNIRDNRGSGKAPTKQMLDQERKIRNQYQVGGQIPTVQGNFKKQNEYGYMVTDEEALAKEAQRLNSKRVLTEGGSLIIFDNNWNIIAADDNPSAPYKQGGSVTLNAGGEQHKIYVKSTNRGEGNKGHIMVNHPTMDKGMWDTIDLTQKAGAKTIAQGVAATKEWHRENPYMKQRGGERNNNLKNINLNLPVIRHQEMNPFHFNGFLANDRNENLFIGGINPRYQNEDFSVGPYMIGVGNKYFQKFPADMGMSGTYHVNDNFDINMGAGQNNINAGIKYNFANGGYVVRRSHDRKGKTHVVTGPDGTKKYFGDPNMGERGNSKYGKEAFYARHKSNLAKNPYFRAYARATWEEGGEIPLAQNGVENIISKLNPYNWGVDDYTDKGSFNNAYAAARKAGEKEFMWNNKRINTNMKGSADEQLKTTGIIDDVNKNIESTLDKRIKNNIYNGAYYDDYKIKDLFKLFKATKKEDDPSEMRDGDMAERDLLSLYLKTPLKYKTLGVSKYKPSITKGDKEDKQYYKINKFEKTLDYNIPNSEFDAYIKKLQDMNGMQRYNVGLGDYTIDKGKDDRGDYISYYDKWDINPFGQGKNAPDLSFGIGTPFDVYDRIYYKDYGDGNKKKMYYSDKELSELDIDKKNFDTLALQRELSNRGIKLPKSTKKNGLFDGSFDGILGDETKIALLNWQNKNKMLNKKAIGGQTMMNPVTRKDNRNWLEFLKN